MIKYKVHKKLLDNKKGNLGKQIDRVTKLNKRDLFISTMHKNRVNSFMKREHKRYKIYISRKSYNFGG